VAVASAGPYASLHLAPDRYHTSSSPLSFLQAGLPFLPPNQQRQNTEGKRNNSIKPIEFTKKAQRNQKLG